MFIVEIYIGKKSYEKCRINFGYGHAKCFGFEVFKYPRTLYAFLLSFDTNDRCVSYCVMFCAQLIVVSG
jgi:hypothetical protein